MNEERDLLLAQMAELRRQVEQLQIQVAACQRPRRGFVAGLVCMALLLGASAVLWLPLTVAQAGAQAPQPPKKEEPQDLTVNSLKVVGPDGKIRLILGYDKTQGNGAIYINGADGNVRALLSTENSKKQYGALALFDESSKVRIILAGNDRGSEGTFFGTEGKQIAFLGSGKDAKTGYVGLFAVDGKLLAYLGGSSGGHGLVQLFANDGKLRVQGFVDDAGIGTVQGLNATGQVKGTLK